MGRADHVSIDVGHRWYVGYPHRQNNARRVKLTLLNLGAVDVFISPSSDVTTSAGLKLVASTGTAESNAADDGEEVIGEVYAIASAAGNTVMISEVLRV